MTKSELLRQDAEQIWQQWRPVLSALQGKRILVTGATGLIGSSLIRMLADMKVACQVIAVVRNQQKAMQMFGDLAPDFIDYIVSDVAEPFCVSGQVDYVIHAANQTSSRAFVEAPVDTILTAVKGTRNVLVLAREKQVKSLVYLSSMEIYGAPQTDAKIYETHGANIDTMATRSSYPESKRMCESLCRAYYAQYGVPAKVIRLSQTFGPGLAYNDGRVPAEFSRCVIEKKNIVLHTDGQTRRSYLYTADAVSAILAILLRGTDGEAYNATNEESYCSILEMAELVAQKCAAGEIAVQIQFADAEKMGYAPKLCMNLDTTKLQNLGWTPRYGLEEIFNRTITSMREARP